MTTVGPAVAELFEQAFHPLAAKSSRPSPEAWIDALDALKASLVPCQTVAWHHHKSGATSCPWCAIEGPASVRLFGGIIKIATATLADHEHQDQGALPRRRRAIPACDRDGHQKLDLSLYARWHHP